MTFPPLLPLEDIQVEEVVADGRHKARDKVPCKEQTDVIGLERYNLLQGYICVCWQRLYGLFVSQTHAEKKARTKRFKKNNKVESVVYRGTCE